LIAVIVAFWSVNALDLLGVLAVPTTSPWSSIAVPFELWPPRDAHPANDRFTVTLQPK
jgi:hypothetical protein